MCMDYMGCMAFVLNNVVIAKLLRMGVIKRVALCITFQHFSLDAWLLSVIWLLLRLWELHCTCNTQTTSNAEPFNLQM